MSKCFISALGSQMEDFIVYRQALGYSATTYTARCKNLDKYCSTNFPTQDTLTEDVVYGWLIRRTGEGNNSFNGRAGFIRVFARYLNSIGKNAYILPDRFTGGKSTFSPYLLTDGELKELFHEIDTSNVEDTFTSYLLSTIFRLIYTCGLRPNEGRQLKRQNIDF